MNNKVLTLLWSSSLMVIGIASVLLVAANGFGLPLSDSAIGLLGILELIALPVLSFTTVKKLKK